MADMELIIKIPKYVRDAILKKDYCWGVTSDPYYYLSYFHKAIKNGKPLPKPKTGRWITQWNAAHQKEYYYCSECREEFSYDGETGIKMSDYDFCPNCGSKMEELK